MIPGHGKRHLVHDESLVDAATALAEFERDDASRHPLSVDDGRGTVWACDGGFGPAVMKAYRRGGLLGRFIREDYLWMGASRCRSLAEFHLLRAWSAQGLPVPRPIAAYALKRGLTYRARLLTRRIESPNSLLRLMQQDSASAPWETVGRCIARLHLAGACHADLNATNVLIDRQSSVWVIDWDKAVSMSGPGPWVESCLQRLRRGLLKHRRHVEVSDVESGFDRLRRAHDEALKA